MSNSKICSFILSGLFASFRKPDANNFYISHNTIPYSAVLGVMGAIIGKKGYTLRGHKSLPEFYEDLKSLYICIASHKTFNGFQKHFVKYSNFHGYGSNEKGGNLLITEQILISPRWKIYLFDERNNHQELIDNLKSNQTIFTPYLGKNEFRAQIDNFREFSAEEITEEVKGKKAMKIDSIALFDKLEDGKIPISKSLSKGISLDEFFADDNITQNIAPDGFAIFENYPYALGEDLHYKLCLSAFTNWELDTSILKKGTRFFEFTDEDSNKKVIQMFNGDLK